MSGFTATSEAATISWDGGGDGASWDDGTNWSTNTMPTDIDVVRFNSVAPSSSLELFDDRSILGLRLTVAGTVNFFTEPYTLTIGTSGINQSSTNTTTLNRVALGGNQEWAVGGTITVKNGISGTGNLDKTGIGSLTLKGTNSYGNTTISGGTLYLHGTLLSTGTVDLGAGSTFDLVSMLGSSQTIGGLSGVTGSTVALGGKSLVLNTSSDYTFSGSITGATGSSLTKSGTGTKLTLAGDNTYESTTISGGTLQVGNGGTTGSLGSGNVTNNAALIVDRSNAYSFAGDISGSGTLQKSGSGTLTLTGSNSYSGTTTISAGTLQIGSGGATGTLGSGNVVNNAALSVNRSNAYTYGGVISGTGTLLKAGGGTLTLTGSHTYTGLTTISGGTLLLDTGGALANTAEVDLSVSGAIFSIANVTTSVSIGKVTGVTGTSINLGSKELLLSDGSNYTINSVISGTNGKLTKSGGGTLTLTGSNAYTGVTTISAGTLALSGTGALADAGTVDLSVSGAAFDISAISGSSETIGKLTGVTGTTVALGAKELILADASSYTFDGAISGTGGGLRKNGAGTLTLGGTNTYTGVTTISGGTLKVGTGGTSGSLGTGAVTNDAALEVNRSDAYSIAGVISGSGTLLKAGAGTLTLTAANTYTGLTTVSAGTLALSGAGSLANTASVNLSNSGAIFSIASITGPTETIGKVTGVSGSSVDLGSMELLLSDGGSYTFDGAFTGTGSVKKGGAGTLTLTGANTNSGKTEITAGTLLLGASNTLSNASEIVIGAGTTLATGSNSDSAAKLTLGGAATLDMGSGSGSILTFADVGTWTGVLQIWNYSSSGAYWTLGTDKLIFSANTGGVDLSSVTFFSGAGTGQIGVGAGFIGNELVPAPEASTVFSALILLGAAGYRNRRSFLHYRTVTA